MKALIPFRSRHRPSVQLERRPCLIRKEVCPRGQASRHGRSCGFLLLGCLGLLLRRNGAPKLCIACSSTTTAPRKKKRKRKSKREPGSVHREMLCNFGSHGCCGASGSRANSLLIVGAAFHFQMGVCVCSRPAAQPKKASKQMMEWNGSAAGPNGWTGGRNGRTVFVDVVRFLDSLTHPHPCDPGTVHAAS